MNFFDNNFEAPDIDYENSFLAIFQKSAAVLTAAEYQFRLMAATHAVNSIRIRHADGSTETVQIKEAL